MWEVYVKYKTPGVTKMFEISFFAAELTFTMIWLLLRGIVWMDKRRVDWKREIGLLLMYVNLFIIIRYVFFARDLVDGHVQPLVFDSAAAFPLRVNLVPLVHLFDYDNVRDIIWNIAGNSVMFIPSGIILPILYKKLNNIWKVTAVAAIISLCIEIIQLPFASRASDIDDIILNTLGAAMGYGIYAAGKFVISFLGTAQSERDAVIIRTSTIGILTNVLLAAFKAVVGILSHSIAVILDAVNNLSDALSSIITIGGTKLASKLPDKKHPLGHGRIEYLSAMIVSGIVLYAGITSAFESLKKIIHPEKPDYSIVSLFIIVVAVVVKIVLGRYVRAKGEKVNSGSLIASGSDAMFDAILSASVLACAIFFMITGISLEAYVGAAISAFIIKSGIDMMTETLNEILGVRADKETVNKIRKILTSEPDVRGAYDLIMHNYGPGKNYASAHIELPENMTVREVDRLTRRLESQVYRETGVIVTGIGLYSYNTGNDEAARIQNDVRETVLAHDWAIQFHGFYLDMEAKEMTFDVVMSFDIQACDGVKILYEELQEAYPEYKIVIAPDVDISVTE